MGVGVGRGSLVVTEAQTEGGDTRGWHQGGYRFSGGGLVAGGGFSFRVGVRRGGGGGGGVFTDAVWCSDFPLERGRGITAAVEGDAVDIDDAERAGGARHETREAGRDTSDAHPEGGGARRARGGGGGVLIDAQID